MSDRIRAADGLTLAIRTIGWACFCLGFGWFAYLILGASLGQGVG